MVVCEKCKGRGSIDCEIHGMHHCPVCKGIGKVFTTLPYMDQRKCSLN